MQNRQILGLILLGAVIGLGLFVIRPFLAPLTWAAILAYVTAPAYRRILGLSGDRPALAATVAIFLLIVVLVVPVSFLLIRLQGELADVYRVLSAKFAENSFALPDAIARIPVIGPALNETLNAVWNDPERRRQQVKELLEPWIRELAGLVGTIGRGIAQLVVTVIALFFFYRDGDEVLEQVRKGLRKIAGDPAEDYFRAVGDTARAVVFGGIVCALTQGFIAGCGYAIVGLGSPILLGALTALMALIPFVGTVAVWAPAGVWLLLSGQTGAGIALIAWGALFVSSSDNVLRPVLISGVADIPLMLALFGVMGGLLAFGLVGLFLGPLILAVLLAVWRQWLGEDRPAAPKTF